MVKISKIMIYVFIIVTCHKNSASNRQTTTRVHKRRIQLSGQLLIGTNDTVALRFWCMKKQIISIMSNDHDLECWQLINKQNHSVMNCVHFPSNIIDHRSYIIVIDRASYIIHK